MKRILITGANSYVGDSVKNYLLNVPEKYSVRVKDAINWRPDVTDFTGYDVVFNVAGIVHIKETKENQHLYYEINRDLVVKIAECAKQGGVKQFILLSSMSVYGLETGHIEKITVPHPTTAYGKSKLEADRAVAELADETFTVTCLRPPMIYGHGCKGNYQRLRSFAVKCPIFPKYKNQRSMIFIENLCWFVKECIDNPRTGLFFPQNDEYIDTSEMVELIAKENGKKIRLIGIFNFLIRLIPLKILKKVFGDLTYEKSDAISEYGFAESIKLTEKKEKEI